MFKIAVCDDQTQIRKNLCEKIWEYQDKYSLSEEAWDIKEYSNGNTLLEDEEKKDVYFLDLEMPEIDGIEVAKKLKKRWSECNIIILTSHVERIKEGYKVNAFRYMTKPIQFEELAEGLDSLRSSRVGYDIVALQRHGHNYQVMQREIRYLCRENGDTVLYVHDIRFRSERSLEDWEKELNGILFVRCHKGYLVNLRYISDIDNDVVLENGEKIPLSRRKKKMLLEKNIEFDLMYSR